VAFPAPILSLLFDPITRVQGSVPNVGVEPKAVYTNNPTSRAMRGFGMVASALHSYDGIRRFRLSVDDAPAAQPSVPKSRRGKNAVPAAK
jgi:hypothetical protein